MDQKTTVTARTAIPNVTIDEAAVPAHVMRPPHVECVISSRGLEEGIGLKNTFERIPFAIFGVDEAAISQGTNLNGEKVNIAWREGLSLWGTASPIDFEPARAGEEPLLQLRFIHNDNVGILGTTSGHISHTPGGPIGSAGIEISLDK
jgi:hypothetical protein